MERFGHTGDLKDPDGTVTGISGIARDISARISEDAQRDELAAIVDSSHDGIVTRDSDGIIRSWNAAAERLYGYAANEAIGRPIDTIVPLERRAELLSIVSRVLAGERITNHATTWQAKDGTVIDVSLTVSPVIDRDGEIGRVSVMARDMRAQHLAEAQLAQRTDQQQAVATLGIAALGAPDLSALMNQALATVAEVLSPDCCEVLEVAGDKESLLLRAGVGFDEGVVGVSRVAFSSLLYAAFALGSPHGAVTEDYEAEVRFSPSGVLREHGMVSGAAVSIGGHGRPFGVLAAHWGDRRTISPGEVAFLRAVANILAEAEARHRAAGWLAASEQRYRQIVETSNEGIWVYNAERVTTFVNQRMADMLGRTVEEMQGRPVLAYMDAAATEVAQRRIEERSQGAIATYDFRFQHKNGTDVWGLLSSVPLLDEAGEFAGGLVMVADITDRVRVEHEKAALEADLHQAQRLESVGQLAGGIAHDFNNILTVVQNYAEFALTEVEGPVREDIEEIRRAVERAARLTRQLLVFSRREVVAPEVLDLADVVADTERLLRRTIGEHIELTANTGAEVSPVLVDRGQLEQVLVNLAVNSRDAMPDGGMLLIETSKICLDDGLSVSGAPYIPPGEYVSLIVSDTGTGMTAEAREHAFEPFFTTKAPGEGTGLGLATVYGIVKQAEGHITLSSEEGLGATVSVYLPVTSESASEGPRSVDQDKPPGNGRQTVLVVEDEAPVRQLARRILQSHGYAVLDADCGEEALRLCRAVGGQIDLLLTDLVMPGMQGSQLSQQAVSLIPSLRVLYMSGYTDDVAIRHGMDATGPTLLEKPFGSDLLLRRVAETLHSAPSLSSAVS